MTGHAQTTLSIWRIATDTPDYTADDLSGRGPELTGGRWNGKGTRMTYTSTSRALACLETLVHLGGADLPLNRYLVEIQVPLGVWEVRTTLDGAALVGWDAEPPGRVSIDWGTQWANAGATLLAQVPSVVVPEESNVLINPRHKDAGTLSVLKVRKWTYDRRFHVGRTARSERL